VALAREGDGQIALIRGEAGIGKTSVARALAQSLADQAHILWGACDDLLAPRPLGPIADMAVGEPALHQALTDADPNRVLTTLIELFNRALRPTVAIFEDVHWSDGATLDLLMSLGRRIESSHAVMVITFRDPVPTSHPLSVVLGDLPLSRAHSFQLAPLSRQAVMSLSETEAQGSRIWELSDGNPFLVTELIDSPPGEIPVSVADAVRSQVARLAGKGERLVKLVSVVPGRMELALLDEIDAGLGDAIGEAEDLRLLRIQGDTVSFSHELAREAVESTLSESDRRRLNTRVLEACESLGFDVARAAHHARQANEVDAMVRLLPQAAKRAAEAYSHREAVSHLEALEPHLDRLPPGDRAEVHELWATEEGLVSGRGIHHALAAAEIRRRLGDLTGLGASLLGAARSGWFSHQTAAEDSRLAVALAKWAIDELGEHEGETLAAAHAYLAHRAMVHIRHDEAMQHAEQALSFNPHPGATHCTALICIGVVKNERHYPDGNTLLTEASAMARSLGLRREWWWAQLNLILGAMASKDIDIAMEHNDAVRAEIGDDDLAMATFHVFKVAEHALMTGDYPTTESTLETLERQTDHSVWWLAWSRALVRVRRGVPDALASSTHFRSVAEALGEPHPLFHAATLWAEFLYVFERTDPDATARNLGTLAEVVSFGIPWWIADLGLWLWLDGHIDEIPAGAADPVHWLANGEWEKTAEWYASRGLPYEQAIALSLGEEAARMEALHIADRIGARALGSKFRRQLRADGVKGIPRMPRTEGQNHALGLTSRQFEVLRLLAEGLTNSEIAGRLFISPRTAEKHVAAVLARVGASDRHEAVALARQAGGLPGNG
jgi:DNA-binding CsgD family transcriptional regulator